ncbi:MAG: 1-(5-phosphoribosyl)-5-[(5-phosphoribosylamino)methylideneamino]imidazole-4-carboxamide isomerase [Magnetococcales bacterium]|nr:1-(5-phosphoribosyl)-5-[(5-phosphoribosylamino)methylideneamino]imidazole-4-carboxamide isomerase [Magnetococcales bacterium]
MILIPAIDLKDGQCVRLVQGDMQRETVYSKDPAAMAERWQSLGAKRLHLVDLNGAFAGQPVNLQAIDAILARVTIPVEIGGGIRSLPVIERYLAMGIHFVILGSAACHDMELVRTACRLFPGQILVGIDARDGLVAVQGWSEITGIDAHDLARRCADAGVAEIIFTDIRRDGAMTGPNIEATRALAEAVSVPVILSGGISSLEDVERVVAQAGPYANGGRIAGIITGRAIYDGRLDFAAASLRCCN